MAKANVVLPNGTKVEIDGTAEEVAQLLAQISAGTSVPSGKRKRKSSGASVPRTGVDRGGVKALVSTLASEGFFKSKRSLAEIQTKLEELGHIYPVTTISPCLTRMTKKRALRRLKENKVWMYVN